MERPGNQPDGKVFEPDPIKGDSLSATAIRERAARDEQLAGMVRKETGAVPNNREQPDS